MIYYYVYSSFSAFIRSRLDIYSGEPHLETCGFLRVNTSRICHAPTFKNDESKTVFLNVFFVALRSLLSSYRNLNNTASFETCQPYPNDFSPILLCKNIDKSSWKNPLRGDLTFSRYLPNDTANPKSEDTSVVGRKKYL